MIFKINSFLSTLLDNINVIFLNEWRYDIRIEQLVEALF